MPIRLHLVFAQTVQAVRAVDVNLEETTVVVGTADCDVWELPLSIPNRVWCRPGGAQNLSGESVAENSLPAKRQISRRLVCGHAGSLYAVAVHPSNPVGCSRLFYFLFSFSGTQYSGDIRSQF